MPCEISLILRRAHQHPVPNCLSRSHLLPLPRPSVLSLTSAPRGLFSHHLPRRRHLFLRRLRARISPCPGQIRRPLLRGSLQSLRPRSEASLVSKILLHLERTG